MLNYFAGCTTPTEIKKLYRQLAMEHHPDRGGDTATMQQINTQYHEALKRADRTTEKGADMREHTYYYNEEHEQAIIDKISELLTLRLEGVEIWLIGKWIWIQGDTRPHREALKAAECHWHSKRIAWYWKPYTESARYNEHASLNDLGEKYGAKFYEPDADANTSGRSRERRRQHREALKA